jgi:hypothetical protein
LFLVSFFHDCCRLCPASSLLRFCSTRSTTSSSNGTL